MTDADFRLTESREAARPLWTVTGATLDDWLASQPEPARAWAHAHRFRAKPGRFLAIPNPAAGTIAGVLAGVSTPPRLWDFAALATGLPPGRYELAVAGDSATATRAALGWAVGAYRFRRYRAPDPEARAAELAWPSGADRSVVRRAAAGVTLVRDLVNTPAGDFGPADLADAALEVAARRGATAEVIVGPDLLERGYPLIHAVGRAAPQAPRLVDLRWGDAAAPRVTLVGKGVCFDTGGLDIKPRAGMLLMKKDMGGAATALALAEMVMDAGLAVRLRVLLPAVENAVDGTAYHPGDVIRARNGLAVEIGDTDAEGRLVLADALAEGASESPELMLDFATLTGSARVALGPEVPALFTDADALAKSLCAAGAAEDDPVWRLPLWEGYEDMLHSEVGDVCNVAQSPYAGAITAALFLRRFVPGAKAWAHIDLFAWNPTNQPGRPKGGEAQALRAAYRVLADRYG